MWISTIVPPRWPAFEPSSGHAGFVVDKVTLWQVFSEYFVFPWQFLFHQLLHTHHLSSRAGTVGQIVADIPSGLSLTPPQETKYHCFVSMVPILKWTLDNVFSLMSAAVQFEVFILIQVYAFWNNIKYRRLWDFIVFHC
jgi:hypothetical protein